MSHHYRAKPQVVKKVAPVVTRGVAKVTIKKASVKPVQAPPVRPAELKPQLGAPDRKVKQDFVPLQRSVPLPRQMHQLTQRNKRQVQDENFFRIKDLRNKGVGKYLLMVACGPSVLEVDFSPILSHPKIQTMAINKPMASMWPPTYWAFCDQSQYTRNKNLWDQYNSGTLINSSAVAARRSNQVIVQAKALSTGFNQNLHDGYIIGRSSVYANMQTALWMGFEKIFIFGIDMAEVNGALHFYGVNPDVEPTKRLARFKDEAKSYESAANTLDSEVRKRFYFCSSYNPWGFVKLFNHWDHKDAVSKIKELLDSI